MPSLLCRIGLFLSSYAPLFAILGMKAQADGAVMISRTAYTVAVLTTLFLVGFLAYGNRLQANPVKVESGTSMEGEAMSYVVTYLIPFLDPKYGEWTSCASLAVFFIMIAVVYVHANMIHINPLLSLFGYSVVEIEVEGVGSMSLITRNRDLRSGATVQAVRIGHRLLLEKRGG